MNRISAKMKELVAEVIGDGKMFDEARQEEAIAPGSKPVLESERWAQHAPHPELAAAGQCLPPPNLNPMKDFNPAEPAILHDAVTDCIVTWDWERADDFRKNAVYDAQGRVAWDGHVFDGWGNVLGG
jgi:hypothetical protein